MFGLALKKLFPQTSQWFRHVSKQQWTRQSLKEGVDQFVRRDNLQQTVIKTKQALKKTPLHTRILNWFKAWGSAWQSIKKDLFQFYKGFVGDVTGVAGEAGSLIKGTAQSTNRLLTEPRQAGQIGKQFVDITGVPFVENVFSHGAHFIDRTLALPVNTLKKVSEEAAKQTR